MVTCSKISYKSFIQCLLSRLHSLIAATIFLLFEHLLSTYYYEIHSLTAAITVHIIFSHAANNSELITSVGIVRTAITVAKLQST